MITWGFWKGFPERHWGALREEMELFRYTQDVGSRGLGRRPLGGGQHRDNRDVLMFRRRRSGHRTIPRPGVCTSRWMEGYSP